MDIPSALNYLELQIQGQIKSLSTKKKKKANSASSNAHILYEKKTPNHTLPFGK